MIYRGLAWNTLDYERTPNTRVYTHTVTDPIHSWTNAYKWFLYKNVKLLRSNTLSQPTTLSKFETWIPQTVTLLDLEKLSNRVISLTDQLSRIEENEWKRRRLCCTILIRMLRRNNIENIIKLSYWSRWLPATRVEWIHVLFNNLN